jgi:hypothetical protein
MQVQSKTSIRGSERRAFQAMVQISWPSSSGEVKLMRAKCLDLSEEGACLECDQPLDLRMNVYLQAPAYGLLGNASVRHCQRSGVKYIVGLLFGSATTLADRGRKRCLDQLAAGHRETKTS